ELSISIVQGLAITAGVLFAYQLAVRNGSDESETRTIVFTTLIFANIFLCLVNRSFIYSVFDSLRNRNLLFPLVIGTTLVLLFAIIYIPAFASFFEVSDLSLEQLGTSVAIAAASVLWFEVYKLIKRKTSKEVL